MTSSLVGPVVLSFLVAIGGVPVLIRHAERWRLTDVPNERSSHTATTPRGAGLAVAAGALAGLSIGGPTRSMATIAIGAAMLAAVGLIDDRRDLPVVLRLATQLAVAAAVAVTVYLDQQPSGALLVPTVVMGTVAIAGFE